MEAGRVGQYLQVGSQGIQSTKFTIYFGLKFFSMIVYFHLFSTFLIGFRWLSCLRIIYLDCLTSQIKNVNFEARYAQFLDVYDPRFFNWYPFIYL